MSYNPYNTRSKPIINGKPALGKPIMPSPQFSMNKPIAVLLWALACITTYQLVLVVRPELELRLMIAAAIITQIVFTWLERPILGGMPNKISSAAILIDTLINAGGIFPMALRAADTPPAQMLIVAFHLAPQMSPIGGAFLALLFGFLLAAAPEAVWHWKG